MNEFGHFSLSLSWLLALLGVAAGIYAGIKRNRAWCSSAASATVLCGVCSLLATAALGYCFVTDDYTNQYVWRFSNADMPAIYKITAIWGGMDGSMLLWCAMLGLCSALVAWRAKVYPRALIPWVLAAMNSSSLFFLSVVVFFTNPFRYLNSAFIPPDGNGLNPLLQNPYMAIHPPMLYAGFTTFAIPFAFCLGALLSGCVSNEWIRLTRRWTLIAWGFLTCGITLGGHWAYLELGWGGFWAWDPVENASFLPWLTGTAFLHSVMVQERKNMLKFWNIWLVVLTYGLTVFGTFLTRSGVVESVHAFASTDVGWIFLVYLGLIFGVSLVLTIWRRKELVSERRIESLFSREAAFLLNNLVFLSICFATLWGVMFPVLSEAITGVKQAVGIPFFNAVNVPLFLVLIFLMGIGPLIAWRKASFVSLSRTFLWPFLSSFLVAVLLVWAGVVEFYPVLAYSLCFFVLLTVLGEFHRGLGAQRLNPEGQRRSFPAQVNTLVRRHRARYGGYLIHVGVLIATLGITASMAHKMEREFTLSQGESYKMGRFSITLEGLNERSEKNFEALSAQVTVRSQKNNEIVAQLDPELRFYKRNRENTTEVALKMGLREDLYLVLVGLDDSGKKAALKMFINPLQVWLWIGVLVMLGGTAILLVPQPVSVSSEAIQAGASARAIGS